MNYDWLIYFWGEILYSFVIVMLVADVCMILFVAGLAVIERFMRRTLLSEPATLKDVARQIAEIRRLQ